MRARQANLLHLLKQQIDKSETEIKELEQEKQTIIEATKNPTYIS